MNSLTAIVLIFDGVEELEAIAPVDCLRRAGVKVSLHSASGSKTITGRNGIVIEADDLYSSEKGPWDLVIIPGGPGHDALRSQPEVLELIRQQVDRGGFLGSICAGPRVLETAGVLEGKSFTSFPATAADLPRRQADLKVVTDGKLITAQGAGCAIDFALEMVGTLCGPDKQAEIAESICY